MRTIICPNCQSEISSEANFCTYCGFSLSKVPSAPPSIPIEDIQDQDQGVCQHCGNKHTLPYPSHCQACGYPLIADLEIAATSHIEEPLVERPSAPPVERDDSRKLPTIRLPGRIIRQGLIFLSVIAVIVILGGIIWSVWSSRPVGEVEVEVCKPVEPGDDFVAANQRGLSGELNVDSYFKAGEEYTIADNATLTVPSGVTLIIEPGVRVKLGQGARLVVGGTLQACGKRSRRILFTADTTTGKPGYWAGIEFINADKDSVIGHATIEFGGKDGHAPIWLEDTDLHIENVKFDSNGWYSLSLNPDSYPRLRIPFEVENGLQGWEVRGGVLNRDRTWFDEPPFVINGTVEISKKASLTILDGGWVGFLPGGSLRVIGRLSAIGTASRPILFTSAFDTEDDEREPEAGDWAGLQFVGKDAEIDLEFAEVRFAGGDPQPTGCLWLNDSSPNFKDVTVSKCAAFSLSSDIASIPLIENLVLTDSNRTRWWEIRSSRLEGNAKRRLSVLYAADNNEHITPVVTGWISVDKEAALSIDPNVTMLFTGGIDSGLWIEGSLKVNGTEMEPVVMTSLLDEASGGEGGAMAGDWRGLVLIHSEPDTTDISNLLIRYAGAGDMKDNGCLILDAASPTISDLTISDCATFPLSSDASSEPVIRGMQLGNNVHPNVWEIRASSLEENRKWQWSPVVATDGSQVIRIVSGQIIVSENATLNFQPGLTLKFMEDAALIAQGALVVEGSIEEPILLTSWRDELEEGLLSSAEPGDWLGVILDGVQTPKKLQFVKIRFAGSVRHKLGCLTLNSSSPDVTDVILDHCEYYPLCSDLSSEPAVERLIMRESTPTNDWAIRESSLDAGMERRWTNLVQDDGSGPIDRVVVGNLTIKDGAKLTLEKGVLVKFQENVGLWVKGTMDADGSQDQPVIFTSYRDPQYSEETAAQSGDWFGLIYENAHRNNRLNHVEIRYAGRQRNPRGSIVLANSSPLFSSLTVRNSAWYPISQDIHSVPHLENIAFNDNVFGNAIEVRGGPLDAVGETIWAPWFDYEGNQIVRVVSGELKINQQSTLRIDAGVVVKFDTNGSLKVHGGLLSTDVVFTSFHDDEYGGDTNGIVEGNREWRGLYFVNSQLVRLTNSVVRFAQTGLWLENASPQILNSRIEASSIAAVSGDILSTPDISGLILSENKINGMVLRDRNLPQGESRWGILADADHQLVRVIEGELRITPGSHLVIEPGVVIKFTSQGRLIVEGELRAGLIDSERVTFTSLADDSVGGDTDGIAETPMRGGWQGITVNPNTTDAKLTLLGVSIRYASIGLFLLELPEWEFAAVEISESQFFGLSCDAASYFVYEDPELVLINNGSEILTCPTPDRSESSP